MSRGQRAFWVPLAVAFVVFTLWAVSAPAQAAQEPKGEVMVPKPDNPEAKTGVYYTEISPAAKCGETGVYFTPETYNNFNDKGQLIERGSRGPFADAAAGARPLFGSHKVWTPAGAWNDRLITLYPLPLVIQPHLCLYDGSEATGCSKNCPDRDLGLQFGYPKYLLENRYEPNNLPQANCTQPGAFQRVMDFTPNLTVWAGDPDGAAKGRYRLPYHDTCIHDPDSYCTVKTEAAHSIKSWSDWAATFVLHADNNPSDKPGLYDISCTFSEGSPLVLLEFDDSLPKAVLWFDHAPKMNAISGSDYAGQPYLEYPDHCQVSTSTEKPDCGAPKVTCAAPGAGQFLLSGHVYDFAGKICLPGIRLNLHDNRGGSEGWFATTDETGYYCFVVDRQSDRDCHLADHKDEYTIIAQPTADHCFPVTYLVCPSGTQDMVQDVYAGGQPDSTYAFVLPAGATRNISENGVVVTFNDQPVGGKWIVAILMPDVPTGKDKKTFWTDAFKAMLDSGGAYGVPRDTASAGVGSGTRISPWPPQYDENSRSVTTTFNFNPSVPAGLTPAKTAVMTGLFPHQWRTDRGNSSTASFLKAGDDELAYSTAFGKLRLASLDTDRSGRASFQTCMAFPGILPEMPNVQTTLGLNTAVKAHFKDVAFKDALSFEIKYPWDRWASYPDGPTAAVDPFKNNTYDTGKVMGERAVLARISKNLGSDDLFRSATAALKRDLESWLGGGKFPDDSGKQNFLHYDGAWGMVIGYPPAYYSEAHTTDLHFHYGYWIRSAAEIARQDKDWIPKWGPIVNLLAKTIANRERSAPDPPDNQNPAMPFLAFFDPYQGHSWAKGLPDAKIDQESSSEAMNAWTGLILWGQEWGQAQDPPDYSLRDLGIWMYTTEMNSIYNYWFDVYKQVLPAEWGDRGSYHKPAGEGAPAYTPLTFQPIINPHESALTTNFGMHPDFLSAINWLPFHGGSFYLSSDDATLQDSFQKQLGWAYWNQLYLGADMNWETNGCLSSAHETTSCGGPNHPFCPKSGWSDGWAERMFMFGSMQPTAAEYNSDRALAEMIASQTKPEPPAHDPPLMASAPDLGDSISNAYYWIYNMGELGVRMEGVTANSPFAVAFFKDGTQDKTSYVAWNPGTASGPYKDVTFKDAQGKTLYEMKGLTNDEVRVTSIPRLPGDGNGDGAVNIAEVQQSINMFLGTMELGNGADCDLDDSVEIHEVQKVINAFLGLPSSC